MKNNFQALQYARAQLGKQYWFACYGQLGSEKLLDEKRKQCPKYYSKWPLSSFEGGFGQKVHDCSGLAFKGYMMSKDPDAPAKYIQKYDISADAMIKSCTISGAISSMPDIPGVLVWKSGHIGIYEGNGVTIEAKGHADGVVRTTNTKWTRWGLCPWWEYITVDSWLTSLYKDVLNRQPEADGLEYWREEINRQNQSPSQVIRFFLTSPELSSRNLSDKDYLSILYRVLFDREPDDAGLEYWLGQMKTQTRETVLDGFIYSREWSDMEQYLLYIL